MKEVENHIALVFTNSFTKRGNLTNEQKAAKAEKAEEAKAEEAPAEEAPKAKKTTKKAAKKEEE